MNNNCDNEDAQEDENAKPRKKRLAKVFWYFPLIPRLKRLYMSSKTDGSIRWHLNGRKKKLKVKASNMCVSIERI